MSHDKTEAQRPERRATDVMPRQFAEHALKGGFPGHAALSDADVETIDMDAVPPPGHLDHHRDDAPPLTALSAEQKRCQLQLVKFKQTFDEFEPNRVSQLTINKVKRGDVIEIKTIGGSFYIQIIDRMRGDTVGAGEILGECHYDLQEQWVLSHPASITLPICTKDHVIVQADGSQRLASRALKMTQESELPEPVSNLLRENFFTEIHVHATPVPDKLRVVDLGRFLLRIARKVKRWIDENNRHEREKKEQEAARKLAKKLEKEAKKKKPLE